MIRIGTSGFAYDDWQNVFYPAGVPARDQLSYYAREFSTVELNVTYYRVPSLATVSSWVKKTPPGFLFAVKAYQGLTHDRSDPDFAGFTSVLQPMIQAGKLGCVLAQFPYSFHPDSENAGYLEQMRHEMAGLPLVVELRNAGWVRDETFDLLRRLGLGYCCVDEPHLHGLMPPVAIATAEVAYVRFHGRNWAKWYNHEQAWERYNYLYSKEELQEWVPKIQDLEQQAETTLIYFNNHYTGQSVQGARDLQQLLLDAA